MGSGTTLKTAAEQRCRAYGYDLDPLAVLVSGVATKHVPAAEVTSLGSEVSQRAQSLDAGIGVPGLDGDQETIDFVNYWFGQRQQRVLRPLAAVLAPMQGAAADALRVALSSIIVTKDQGASLARDVSHSRPHRVSLESSYDVMAGFQRAVQRIARITEGIPATAHAEVSLGDARAVPMPSATVDLIVTSPPYLNAIDYLRGHKLSLVWFGYTIKELRAIRASEVGAERGLWNSSTSELESLRLVLSGYSRLSAQMARIVDRYLSDLWRVVGEYARVLKAGGGAVVVMGNSSLRSVFIENDAVLRAAASMHGLAVEGEHSRDIPPSRRYLPPPSKDNVDRLEGRLRTETVLVLRKAA